MISSRQGRWFFTSTYWKETEEAVGDPAWWFTALVLTPIVFGIGFFALILFDDVMRATLSAAWGDFVHHYGDLLGFLGIVYFFRVVYWGLKGTVCLAWDLGDANDSEAWPGKRRARYIVRGGVLLLILAALTYVAWMLSWMSRRSFGLECTSGSSFASGDGALAMWVDFLRVLARCTAIPTASGTFKFAGSLTVLIVAASWMRQVLGFGKLGPQLSQAERGRTGQVLSGVLGGIGNASLEIGTTMNAIVAFVKGGLWLGLAAFVIWAVGFPTNIFEWIICGLGCAAGGKGFEAIGSALHRDETIDSESPLGDARSASAEATRAAASGTARKPPWADHPYRD